MSSKLEIAMNEAYKQAGENAYFGTGFKMGAEYMKKEYEEKLRWIPVEERMPDYGVEVFVKYEDTLGTIHPNPAYTVDYAVATSHSKKGFSIEVDYSGRTKEKVTHWHQISFL